MAQCIPKPRATNPTAMAFAFNALETPQYEITRVEWVFRSKELLLALRASLKKDYNLPIRNLRLRFQVRDNQVIRLDRYLGCWTDPTILFTYSDCNEAAKAANAAIAQWIEDPILQFSTVDQQVARQLRKLALDNAAVKAKRDLLPVLHWSHNHRTNSTKPNSATLYADLADFVASKLVGQEVFPEAGAMRRVISDDLRENWARLLSDPIELQLSNGKMGAFSLSLTVRVETYPGLPLPIIQVDHGKAVWAREPSNRKRAMLSGYALPEGESRALRFEINPDLSLSAQYVAIARQYQLPTGPPNNPVTASRLGLEGISADAFRACKVTVTHRHGQAEKKSIGRGVTDLDRQLSYESLTQLLQPYGFYPWETLQELPTHYNQQQNADNAWRFAQQEEESDNKVLYEKFLEWAGRMHYGIRQHYNGVHHFVLAYQNGLQKQALKARDILVEILGEHKVAIHLEALPEGVHGSRWELSGEDKKPFERAQERIKAWAPFVKTLKDYMAEHQENPVRGVLILADKWYNNFPDDNINKKAGRTTLNRELGLIVQYLLPIKQRKDGSSSVNQEEDFRMRVVNAWRDMTWKSLGKMNGVQLKYQRSSQEFVTGPAPVVLAIGIIRSNRKRKSQNLVSFIPYAIEMNPSTGSCQASLLLQSGNAEPTATPMQELSQVVKQLTLNGPSYLANKDAKTESDTNVQAERKSRTEKFIRDIITERARQHEQLIVLADSATLGGTWTWLSGYPKNTLLNVINNSFSIV